MLIRAGEHPLPMRRPTDRLRSAGAVAWSVVGAVVLGTVVILLLTVFRSMILALVIALFLAVVFAPLVDTMARHGLPRAAGAAAATLMVIAGAAGATALVVVGVAGQQQAISQNLSAAVTQLEDLLASAGFGPGALDGAQGSLHSSAAAVLNGLLPALGNLFGTMVNVVVGVFVALFTCFFLLKDGGSMAARARRLLPVPERVGGLLLDEAAATVRKYFVGLTILGLVNAAVMVVGTLVLDVPLVGAIAVLALLGSYVPYFGAVVAGAFAVLIALGAGGTSTALWMLLVVFVANSVLQNLVSPFTYGAALKVSPLVLLLSALIGAAVAGVAGVTLSAPVAAIAIHSARLLREERLPAAVAHPSDPV